METLLRNLRYAVQGLFKRPLVTAAAILCLGLGIGAVAVMFTLVDGVLLRPLPYEDPEGIFAVWLDFPSEGVTRSMTSGEEYLDLREETGTFESFTGEITWYFNITSVDPPQQVGGARLSANAFPLLGVEPALGRTFTQEEVARDERLVVLSHGLWERIFGGDPGILGMSVSLDKIPYTVVGVMPSDFRPLSPGTQLWTPLVPNRRIPRNLRGVQAYSRLAEGLDVHQARAALEVLEQRFAQEYPDIYSKGWGITLEPFHETVVGEVRGRLLAFFGAVVLVLAMACANVANLLLVQAMAREREVALRAALGADRRSLIAQFLTESLTLSVLGALFGLVLAYFGTRLVVAFQQGDIPRLAEIGLDGRVLAFTSVVALTTGVAFGLAPALRASRLPLRDALKEGSRSSAAGHRHPLLDGFVVIEVALAVVVLAGTGLMLRSLHELQDVDPGFRTEDLVALQIALPRTTYGQPSDRVGFYQRLRDGLQNLPGVENAGIVSKLPFTQAFDLTGTLLIDGQDPNDPGPAVGWRTVSPEYFAALGIPLVQGRTFDERDDETSPPVVVLDAASAARLWPDENPVGQRLRMVGGGAGEDWREVVGVVGRIKDRTLTDNLEVLYAPYRQYPARLIGIGLHTTLTPQAAGDAVRELTRGIDPEQPVAEVRYMSEIVAAALTGPRFNLLVFGLFGAVALVLAAVGVYGVMSYSVTQRTGEIGVRRALGAQVGEVLNLILGRSLKLTGLGLALGLVLSWLLGYLLSRLLDALLYGVAATDLATFTLVSLAMLLVAILAGLLPASRAARIDPMVALRDE